MQLLFALTLLTSAALLFVVQPMFAKMVLPRLGGTPAVWNTCMVFYQAALLAGYVYAHWSVRWLGARRQAAFHLLLLALPWLVLPIMIRPDGASPPVAHPIPGLLMLLTLSVGLPFFVVSASAPMLQAWFSQTAHPSAKDPYFLYSASNLGSMLALLGYPLAIEPLLPLAAQSRLWMVGYGWLTVLTAFCAVTLWRSPRGIEEETPPDAADAPHSALAPPPTWRRRLYWLALSLVPSSLLLGVTTHLSTDVAAVPLLWVIPLALYLLTFVLVFARRTLLPHGWMVWLQTCLVIFLAAIFFQRFDYRWMPLLMLLHLAAFFVTAMVCHGELARQRPEARYLTEFYLWMSLGGVLGGMVNALIAPMLFRIVAEYPMMIAVACFLRPQAKLPEVGPWRHRLEGALASALLLLGYASFAIPWFFDCLLPSELSSALLALGALVVFQFRKQTLRFGMGISVLLLLSFFSTTDRSRLLHVERSFFGVLRVKAFSYRDTHVLMHGSTTHGVESLESDWLGKPLSYYHRNSPFGQVYSALSDQRHCRRIGAIGLGTGTIAAFGRPGQEITFYEIDPAVIRIAQNPRYFTFLDESQAAVRIVLGDARLSLQVAPDRVYDLLVMDAFSSDAIPIHLLTREAIQLYLRKLAEGGVIAIHISNRHLDLAPLLGRLAADAGVISRLRRQDVDSKTGEAFHYSSVWVLLARRPECLGTLAKDSQWTPIPADPHAPLWTDDYSNILAVLKR
jgi:SAM-dependent methyltransferase